jgi:excisionase family DNA binding protein
METRNEPQLPEFLTVGDVAARLNVSPQLVYKLVNAGKMKSYQFGSRKMIRSDALDIFIQKSEFAAQSQ